MPREVAIMKIVREQWVMKFDGSYTANSGGAGVVLYHSNEEAIALSSWSSHVQIIQ